MNWGIVLIGKSERLHPYKYRGKLPMNWKVKPQSEIHLEFSE